MNKQYKTAIYLRLSREDGDGESSSIENQRLMLQTFIAEREDLELVTEYVDDGYSGYAFDRPAFQEMLQAAKSGSIDCIVVKDLSRLGRNFGKTEEYLQRVFPKYHIRFIAVNDCFDSSREQSAGDRLTKPLINLMNEFHVAETSQKVRAVLEHHRRNGKFIGNHAPYGYRISKKSLVVDEEAARIVRMIFRMKIEGSSNQAISDYLNDLGVKSPLEYKLSKGIAATGKHLRKEGKEAEWSSVSVRRILENPVYIGTLAQGKTTSFSYRDKRRRKRPLSEQSVFENAHDPVIPRSTFMLVQDLLSRDSYSKSGCNYLFSTFAFCGGCGQMLYHRKDGNRHAWQCRNKECTHKGNISEKALADAVLATLRTHIQVVLNPSEPVAVPMLVKEIRKTDDRILILEQQIQHLQEQKTALSEKKSQGVIDELDEREMNRYYDDKIAQAEAEKQSILDSKIQLTGCMDEIRSRYAEFCEAPDLTRAMVVTFLDRITVYSKEHIHLSFRYSELFGEDGGADGS